MSTVLDAVMTADEEIQVNCAYLRTPDNSRRRTVPDREGDVHEECYAMSGARAMMTARPRALNPSPSHIRRAGADAVRALVWPS